MRIYDRSALEKLYNACIADNISLDIGVYLEKGDLWEYVPPGQFLYGHRNYKAVFKLSNIGREIDFKDLQLRLKKMEDTLPIELYKELGQEPVEQVDFTDIPRIVSADDGGREPTEAYRSVYFRPERQIEADERHKLFRIGVYATVVPRGHHWPWAHQGEFSVPTLHAPGELKFGDVAFTQTLTKTIELSNTGEGNLTITKIVVGENRDFDIAGGVSLPYAIPAGQKLSLSIEFSPSELGQKQGSLTVQSTDPANATSTVRLVGNGVHSFRAIPDSIGFGTVLVSKTEKRRLKLQNDGQEDVKIRSIQVSGRYFSCDASQLTVRARGASFLDISFSPSRKGMRTGTLTAVSDYSPKPEIEITLRGEGMPWLTAPGEIDFGEINVNRTVSKQITIKNIGPFSCDITKLRASPGLRQEVEFGYAAPIEGPLPFTLGPNHSFILPVWAKPTALGVQRGSLAVSYRSADETIRESLTVTLRVKGIPR
ncbi:MAG: choice-of-anchor D domain-containing protein [Deltaproteobacteria bacterium]|nr:choice-of-anchor D domain-containing protein [Deltaproteobacteria bacterium]MBW2339316.1 choice-of-anchor D domain-containing protein [Deltaproteobacteria bacterium]